MRSKSSGESIGGVFAATNGDKSKASIAADKSTRGLVSSNSMLPAIANRVSPSLPLRFLATIPPFLPLTEPDYIEGAQSGYCDIESAAQLRNVIRMKDHLGLVSQCFLDPVGFSAK